jgi:hypothetical protein
LRRSRRLSMASVTRMAAIAPRRRYTRDNSVAARSDSSLRVFERVMSNAGKMRAGRPARASGRAPCFPCP